MSYEEIAELESLDSYLNIIPPIVANEGFCLYQISSSSNACARLEEYNVRVQDGGLSPGVRTQAIIGSDIYVWIKDSVGDIFYEVSAPAADFLERGENALTIKLSNIGGGDATAISQALSFDFDGFLDFDGISVNRVKDSQSSARIQIEFGERLSDVVSLPQVSLLGAATELEISATEYSANDCLLYTSPSPRD